MRRSRNAPPKVDEGGDDSGQMVVGTGVTMDFSAMDDPSLTVVVRGVMRHAVLKTENVIVTGRLHGNVEAKTLEISKGALFLGKAMVGSATVAGRLEGILVVGNMLTMRSSGHCDGVLRYGQLNVQHGGKLTGAVKAASPADVGIGDIPVPDLPPGTWDDFWGKGGGGRAEGGSGDVSSSSASSSGRSTSLRRVSEPLQTENAAQLESAAAGVSGEDEAPPGAAARPPLSP